MQIQPSVINIFEKAVRKAGKRLLRDFGEIENLQIQSKICNLMMLINTES